MRRQLGDDELRFALFVIKFPPITRVVRQIKNVFANPRVEIIEPGDHMLDVIADAIVISNERVPINGRARAQRRFGKARNDGRLASKMFARRLRVTSRQIDDPHRIFDRYKLVARFLSIDFRTAETGQNKRNLAGDKVCAV